MTPVTVEVWSDVAVAGGQRLAVAATPVRGTELRTIVRGQVERITGTVSARDPLAAALARDAALKVTRAGAHAWYRVADLDDEDSASAASVRFTADPILHDLGVRGLVRDLTAGCPAYSVNELRRTPTQVLTDHVFTHLAADGLAHWEIGTIEATAVLEVVAFSRWTRLQVVRWLEEQTGAVAVVRDTGSALALDLLTAPGASAPPVLFAVGGGVASIARTRRAADRVTAVEALGAVVAGSGEPATMAEAAFEVTDKTGSVLTLADPVTGAAMLAAGVDLTGARLLARDGTLDPITATDGAASTVTVTTPAKFTVGDVVGIRADAAGALLTRLSTGATPARVRQVTVASARGERNWVANPLFLDWTSVSEPAQWTEIGTAFRVGEYLRDSPTSFAGAVADGSNPAGTPNVNVRGVPAGARFYRGEIVATTAGNYVVAANVAVANGSGVVSLPLTTNLASTVADGSVIGLNTFGPLRPASFPDETYTAAVLRMMSPTATTDPPSPTADRLQSAAFGVPYLAGPCAQLNVAAAFTMARRAGQAEPTTGPCVMLRDHDTDTRLAFARMTTYPDAGATAHQTVTASTTLTADTTVDVCLVTGSESYWHGCRWVMVWLGPTTAPPQTVGSMANDLWHAAKRALGDDAASYRVALADLDPASLTLGGPARLRSTALSLDTTARIVGIQWDLADPRRSQVVVDRPLTPFTRQV